MLDSTSDCISFVGLVRQYGYVSGLADGDTADSDLAVFAGRHLNQKAATWMSTLDRHDLQSWTKLEKLLLTSYPDDPPTMDVTRLEPAGRILVRKWEMSQAAGFPFNSEVGWLGEARARRRIYDLNGVKGSTAVHWVLIEGEDGTIPAEAIQTGTDVNGQPLYTARTWYQGELFPGKCGHELLGMLLVTLRDIQHWADI